MAATNKSRIKALELAVAASRPGATPEFIVHLAKVFREFLDNEPSLRRKNEPPAKK